MTRQERSAASVIIGTIVVVAASMCVYAVRQVDPDLFGYFDYGRLFLQQHSPIIHADPFAYTSAGFRWITFEYLSQVLLWTAFHQLGAAGLIGLKCVVGGAAVWFLWQAVRTTTDDPIVWVPVFLLCTSTASRYFVFRPQLFTFACFAFFVAVLFRFLLRGTARLWLLPPVMLLWANAHGAFLAGLGAIALAILIRIGQTLSAGAATPGGVARTIRPLALTFAACTAMSLLNPWGPRLWVYVLSELSHSTNRRYIAEWQPLSWHRDPWSTVALTFLVVTLVVVAWAAQRDRQRPAGVPAWLWALSCGPLIVMAYGSVRHVPLATIWLAPVIALLASAANLASLTSAFRPVWLAFAACALVPVLLTARIVSANPWPRIAVGGMLLGSRDPCRVVTFIRENHLSGNLFNPLWWGSYLTWNAYPAIRVSMDGRNITLFPDAMVAENLHFYSREAGREDLEAPLRYQTDFLLLSSDAAILRMVRSDDRWAQMYADDDASLFVRANAAHESFLNGVKAGSFRPPREACAHTLR